MGTVCLLTPWIAVPTPLRDAPKAPGNEITKLRNKNTNLSVANRALEARIRELEAAHHSLRAESIRLISDMRAKIARLTEEAAANVLTSNSRFANAQTAHAHEATVLRAEVRRYTEANQRLEELRAKDKQDKKDQNTRLGNEIADLMAENAKLKAENGELRAENAVQWSALIQPPWTEEAPSRVQLTPC